MLSNIFYNNLTRCFIFILVLFFFSNASATPKAFDTNANTETALCNLGLAYRGLGNYDKAINCYQQAIAIDANYVIAWSNLGLAYSL